MKMIADNYEEDHIHPQHHPHHSHHLHSANVHHRSLPRGPPHPNHRPPMDQVIMNVHTQTQAGTDRHTHSPTPKTPMLGLVYTSWHVVGSLLHAFKVDTISYLSSPPVSCGWTRQHEISPLSSPLSLLPQPHYFMPSQTYSYQRDKEPEGESCQMSVFDRWDLCVRLVYISLTSHTSSFFLSVSYPDYPEDRLNVSV